VVEALVNSQAAYDIAPQVLASVIRISTHARIYVQPSTLLRHWSSVASC
jgi:hypothetical protein